MSQNKEIKKEMEEPREWMRKAEKDVKTAKVNLNNQEYEAAAFFAQQAAEKALKALWIKKLGKLFKTHDLVILARRLNAPDKIINLCKELTPAYVYTRYPDVIQIDDISNVSCNLIKNSEEIIKWVKENI